MGVLNPLRKGSQTKSLTGTSVEWDIPTWAREITVNLSAASTSGSSAPQVQLYDSAWATSGYQGTYWFSGGGGGAFATGFGISGSAAANLRSGSLTLKSTDGLTWFVSGVVGISDAGITSMVGAVKTLSSAITKLRLIMVNGTDTWDGGTATVQWSE